MDYFGQKITQAIAERNIFGTLKTLNFVVSFIIRFAIHYTKALYLWLFLGLQYLTFFVEYNLIGLLLGITLQQVDSTTGFN